MGVLPSARWLPSTISVTSFFFFLLTGVAAASLTACLTVSASTGRGFFEVDGVDVCESGGVGIGGAEDEVGLIGREKFTDNRGDDGSGETTDLRPLGRLVASRGAIGPRSRLTPRSLAVGSGDRIRCVGSALDGRRTRLPYFFGTGGKGGGASWSGDRPEGDGSRNVRSVKEPELPRRPNGGALPFDDVEALLCVRLV